MTRTKNQIPFKWIDLTEEMVYNPPRNMEGWREYRIEYGGIHQDCLVEGSIWLPRHADPDAIVAILKGMIEMENDTLYGDEMMEDKP
jgi:hypothetical protein